MPETSPSPTHTQEKATKAHDAAAFLTSDLHELHIAITDDELLHICMMDLLDQAHAIRQRLAVIEREVRRRKL